MKQPFDLCMHKLKTTNIGHVVLLSLLSFLINYMIGATRIAKKNPQKITN